MSVCVPPTAFSCTIEVSPVKAPSSAKWIFCAPTATFDPLHPSTTVGSSTGEGNRAISSRVCQATSGKKASTNALASAGVLYIFQLAAISALRDIFQFPQLDFSGWISSIRVMASTE